MSNTWSIPLLVAAGLTLTVGVNGQTAAPINNYKLESQNSTMSYNSYMTEIAHYYSKKSPREEAFSLFEGQKEYSKEERELYKRVLLSKSKPVGINVNDFFG